MKETNRSDKWHFLKVVDNLDELDRVRRQHQMQLETEDELGIIFKCHGSAHCPYRMTFFHDRNAIYIRHAHNHDSIVPIVGRTREEDIAGTSSSSSGAFAEQQKSGQRKRVLDFWSDDASEGKEKEGGNSGEDEGKRKREKERKRGKVEERREREAEKDRHQTDEDELEEGGHEEEEEDGTEQDDDGDEGEEETEKSAELAAKKGTNRAKKAKKAPWRSLGKISGAIDDVCREVCQSHFVRRGGRARNKKIFFKCPNGKCNYRAMINADERLLYCRASHNHSLPSDDAGAKRPSSPLPSSATCSSPHSKSVQLSLSCASSSASSANSYYDNSGKEWILAASRVFNRSDIAQFCRVHSLRLANCRPKRVYLRCDRFASACPYRVTWHRIVGRVYHRGRHNHTKLGRSRAQQRRQDGLVAALRDDGNDSDGRVADKMPKLCISSSSNAISVASSTAADEQSPAQSFVDSLGKEWTFLAKLHSFGWSSGSRNTRSASVAMASVTLEQQLEQLCAERHLSRSRLASSATRVWLHCALQRQPGVECPYRVVVHLPEGTIFHRLQHNHSVPYNLSDTEKENGQRRRSANDKQRTATPTSPKTVSAPPSPAVRHRPETRSSTRVTKRAAANGRAKVGGRRPMRQAFAKARDAMKKVGGGARNEEEEHDEDEAMSSDSDHTDDEYDTDTDHSAGYRLRAKMCSSTWPRSEVRIKRDAFVKARASISNDVQTGKQPTPTEGPLTPSLYKFASKNWHFLVDKIWHKKALTEFCKTNMLRIAGGIITNSYRNRLLCVRSGCPFRALWLNRQGLVYGLRRHNHAMPSKVKEEPTEFFQLADMAKEIEALAQRHSLHFRVDNDVFVLMLRTEVGDQWLSRLLMLREDQSSIRLAEFTGCREEFSEKAENWLKADFDGHQQLIDALNAKCVEYFQQQKQASSERTLPS